MARALVLLVAVMVAAMAVNCQGNPLTGLTAVLSYLGDLNKLEAACESKSKPYNSTLVPGLLQCCQYTNADGSKSNYAVIGPACSSPSSSDAIVLPQIG